MSSLFSPAWYRVADLRPRLRSQAQISRHIYRGERWHLLQDRGSGRYLRLNPAAYRVVVLMDGLRTVDQIWRQACLTQGDDAPTQDEVVQLLGQLHSANVLISDKRPDLDELQDRGRKARRMKFRQYLANPLSLKFPLVDPDRLLGFLANLLTRRGWQIVMWLWAALLISAAGGLMYHWTHLTEDLASRSFTPENMLLLALIYPFLKVVHEFGHGLAIKLFGGGCREMGVMLLVFLPVPYVDAGQATGFPDKRRRMVVGAAGMMAELGVAAIAFWLWSWADTGLLKSVLHQTLVLSGVTTLLFNLNPLLRFDGYYILADWLEIPNLGNKANQYLGYLVSHHVFRSERAEPPPLTLGEGRWLSFYAIASFVYRMTVAVAIIFFVGNAFFFIGVILALWSAWTMLLAPLSRLLKHLWQHAALEGVRLRAWIISTVAVGLLMIGIVWVPAPSWTSAEGVIWMTDDARVRATHPCFGKAVLVSPGTPVIRGMSLLDCGDPSLDTQIAENQARLDELETRFNLALQDDPIKMQQVRAEREHIQNVLNDLQSRRATMVMSSEHDGVFYMGAPGDFPGRYIERGEAVGYVLDATKIALLTVVPQGSVDLVRQRTHRVELRVAGDVWNPVTARIRREVPGATKELPSPALSLAGGGKIGLDPRATAGEATALTPLFQFELALPEDYPVSALGSRVYVRFVHADESLGSQWFRGIRQVFLKNFEV